MRVPTPCPLSEHWLFSTVIFSGVSSICTTSVCSLCIQCTLVSGTNIKTINNESIIGSGNITIQGGGSVDQTIISESTNAVAGGAVYTQLDGLKLKKITQSAYDALSPNYDANTLYVING